MMFDYANLALLLSICLLPIFDATLSKSDAKVKKKASQNDAKIRNTDLTTGNILDNYLRINYEGKKFPNPTLGYVTPWNNHGYDIAKWFAQKFTHISPVWFQINPSRISANKISCKIDGIHDMDQEWIEAIRSNNSAINIVPRFLFEKWSQSDNIQLLDDELFQESCAEVVIDFIQRNRFQGAVLEIWMQMMSMSQGAAASDLVYFVINWAEKFKHKQLQFILPVPPPLDEKNQENGFFTAPIFSSIISHVDYLNIMTFDFPDPQISPVAPLDWVEKCLLRLISAYPEGADKIMMSLNFYGQEKRTKTAVKQPIMGNDFISLIKSKSPKMIWHQSAAEHYIKLGDHVAYYPTVTSIEFRLNMARKLNIGVAIWELGQGLDYFCGLF